jgi:MFS superfamily sulfate permease-like transporter
MIRKLRGGSRGGSGGRLVAPPINRERARKAQLLTGLNEITGAVADLGVLVPLAAALILVNGLDASAVFVGAGLLVWLAGAVFRIPFPVQPLKALTAVAVARELAPDVIHAAGLEIAAFLLVLSMGSVANVVSRAFTKPVVRALQLGVGVLLVISAAKLVISPPEVFRGTPASPWPVVLAVAACAGLVYAARREQYALALATLVGGTAAVWVAVAPTFSGPSFTLPSVELPQASSFATAFVLLVIPQLPLTFGNAVVAVTEVANGYFGERASRVTPARVCVTCGAGNVVSALIGGMPMCHGSGGLTAHVRLGARTAAMNAGLGAAFVVLGVFFASQVTEILGLLPVWALAAFLAYAGLRHAWLVFDLRGAALAVALAAGCIGAVRGNLAITLGIGLVAEHLWLGRRARVHA